MPLPGGNVGGAVRVGDTVRRPVGPWTPAVHALLAHLEHRLDGVPRVVGLDERGREVLTYLPGRVVDVDRERLTPAQLTSLAAWTRRFHGAVQGFRHPGPWRLPPAPGATIIGHNDIAPYNVCFDGSQVVGVFDWDVAAPTTPLLDLAFLAWNAVPLWDAELLAAPSGRAEAVGRLRIVADGYGGVDPLELLRAVPVRIGLMVDAIPALAAAGDAGMARLMTQGEPGRSAASCGRLVAALPELEAALAGPDS